MKIPLDEHLVNVYHSFTDYDTELERNVLGICLVEPRAYSKVRGILSKECFYDEGHSLVYAAMQRVWEYGLPIDLMTVTRELIDNNTTTIKNEDTPYYVATLCRHVVNGSHLQQWCLMLRELAARRLMIELTTHRFKGSDVIKGAEQINAVLQQALTMRRADDWIDASTAALSLTQHMDDVYTQDAVGVTTGFPTLDNLNGGFRPGQLVVIGARPSVGKSALMGGMALNAARQGKKVGIMSLEMPAKDLFGRMVSSDTGVDFAELDRYGVYEEHKRDSIIQSITGMSALPLYFSDAAQCTIHDIRAKAEQLKSRHGLDMLLLDYLQLVEETDTYRSREQGIAQISRGLKMLAMNLEIPVIALSQLNRSSEHRADKRPTMADLRESGAIEQDADIVLLLHRDWRSGIYQDEMGNSTQNQADLIICKWRNGNPQDLKLHFEAETMSFSEAA